MLEALVHIVERRANDRDGTLCCRRNGEGSEALVCGFESGGAALYDIGLGIDELLLGDANPFEDFGAFSDLLLNGHADALGDALAGSRYGDTCLLYE